MGVNLHQASWFASFLVSTHCQHNIVYLQDGTHAFGRLLDCKRGDQQRLDHILLQNVCHRSLKFKHLHFLRKMSNRSNIDSEVFVAICMLGSQLGHRPNG